MVASMPPCHGRDRLPVAAVPVPLRSCHWGLQSTQHLEQGRPGQLPSGALALSPAASASQLTAYWEAPGLQPPGEEAPGDATPPC